MRLIAILAGLALTLGCIEFDSSSNTRDMPGEETVDVEEGTDAEEPQAGGSSGLPPEVVAVLPPGLPQTFLVGARCGENCDDDNPCRDGLSCEDDVCVAVGETEEGDDCIVSMECADGQCVNNVCVPYGEGALGDACLSSAQCGAGLRCGVVNLSTQCVMEGDLCMGAECADSSDCASGLACAKVATLDSPSCMPIPGGPPAVPLVWDGVNCDTPSDSNVRAYFEVPGAEEADEGDFFRLPFPNDALMDSRGRVDVSGFPTPGLNPVVGVDPIQPYVDAVDGMEGWGTNGTVIFRFSGRIDLDSFKGEGGIQWVDITDPEDPVNAGIGYRTSSGRTNYICHNMLTVRRRLGNPMEPGHTYAVWLSTDGRSNEGLEIERSENFEAMLSNSEPSDDALSIAHERYAPFRDYLAAQDISTDNVLVAAVITVGPTRDLMSDLAAAVMETEVPTASDWTLCADGVESPCPQADVEEGRGCGENDVYDEYHALVEVPIFQEGDPPYLEEGGAIDTSGPVRTEPVCMSLSVPKDEAMPEGGWPLVVFTHGTGGSYRSHVRNDAVAQALTNASTPEGTVNFAVLGYDQVQHGPRRGDSVESPDNLFFNFLNPDAAQGNPLQGAADVISFGRFAATLSVDAETTGGSAITIDPERVVYFGHSQGSMHGTLGLPYADEYKGAVLSGNGVSLMHALLSKTQPVNIKAVVPIVVNDGVDLDLMGGTLSGELPDGDHHPVLTLVQQYIDPADPLNFGQQIAREPFEGHTPKHVFATFGLGDTYSPPLTMELYAMVAELLLVEPHSSAADAEAFGIGTSEFPLLASFAIDDVPYTVGMRQYGPPDGNDGHFVVFDVNEARRDAHRFLGMAASGVTPQIGE